MCGLLSPLLGPFAAAAPKRSMADVATARLLKADKEPGEWLTGGRDYRQSYYSPLTDINKQNVRDLGFAWSYDIDDSKQFQATPIVVDGMMYTSGAGGRVYALDAANGKLHWKFEPKIRKEVFRWHCCKAVNRGVAVWRGKVYVASIDGVLYALDAGTGAVVWKQDTIDDKSRNYTSTGAPYIAKELVVIGNSGGEFDVRGYVTAYDTRTGKQAWRFYTVPGDPRKGFEHPELEQAAKTWDKDSLWDLGLGGNAWDGMAYDPELNLLYIGTGNGTPWNPRLRSPAGGDNLFLSSILAIDPDTGRLKWHYQIDPHSDWDFTATQKMILADLRIDGRTRKVIMQAPKNGFFYVLDRQTGELLSAKPYTYVNWASHIDMKTGRPVETGRADYSDGPKMVYPSAQGTHNWHPMSYNPETGLVYLPTLEDGAIYGPLSEPFVARRAQWNGGVISGLAVEGPLGVYARPGTERWPSLQTVLVGEPQPKARTYITAWNPIEQRAVWRVDTSGSNDIVHGYGFQSSVMSTAGQLVFQGDVYGGFQAYDAATGKLLHHIDVGSSMQAAPMTYRVRGEQFVAIMAGIAGGVPAAKDNQARILAFKLGGEATPRPVVTTPTVSVATPPPVADRGTPAQLATGAQRFETLCATCHAAVTHAAPNLTRMSLQTHRDFMDIVLKGTRVEKGMADFSNVLSKEEAESIHAYVIHQAWQQHR